MQTNYRRLYGALLGAALFGSAIQAARGAEVPGYGFESAAQEITQLFWLAETANVCGWTSAEDVVKFKLFAMRFLGSHLSERHRDALASVVMANGYEERIRAVALEGARENCGSNRWHFGWVSYKTAADQHENEF